MTDIYYIVRDEIVAKLDRSLVVESVTIGASTAVALCGGPKWARESKTVTDVNDVVFTIVSVNYDTNTLYLANVLDAFDEPIAPVGPLILELPTFFIGTPVRTNTEWRDFSSNEMNKTPFVWMLEPTSEEIQGFKSSIERLSDIHLVILDSNNSKKWLTGDVHDNRLQPIYNLVEEIRKAVALNVAYFANSAETVKIKNFTRFGSESAQGFDANIIDADLAGVEMRFSLLVIKQACKC